MLPTGIVGLEAQLWVFLVAMIRPGAAFLAAPVFGAQNIPVQVRLIISLAVGIPAIQQVPFELPAAGLVTVMGFMLVAGLVLGMIQAATSINEQTLAFVPKLIIVAICIALFGGAIVTLLADFTRDMFHRIPDLLK